MKEDDRKTGDVESRFENLPKNSDVHSFRCNTWIVNEMHKIAGKKKWTIKKSINIAMLFFLENFQEKEEKKEYKYKDNEDNEDKESLDEELDNFPKKNYLFASRVNYGIYTLFMEIIEKKDLKIQRAMNEAMLLYIKKYQ